MRLSALVMVVVVVSTNLSRVESAEVAADDSTHPTVAAGDRVRLTPMRTHDRERIGRVVRVSDSSLLLQPDGIETAPIRVDWSWVAELEVSRGTHGHSGTGAIVGGLIALPISAFLTGIGNFDCQSRCHDTAGPTVVGTIVGAGLGALIGLAVRTDDWGKPRRPQVSLGVAPVPRGTGATLGLSF